MWTFQITTGRILDPQGNTVTRDAYSGHAPYSNDPTACHIEAVGPLPPGLYEIGPAQNHPHLGPVAMPLSAIDVPEIYGRSGFWMHGDNALMNHTGSNGCVVAARIVRTEVAASTDKRLRVII